MTTSMFQKSDFWLQYGRQVEGKPIKKKKVIPNPQKSDSKPRQVSSLLLSFSPCSYHSPVE